MKSGHMLSVLLFLLVTSLISISSCNTYLAAMNTPDYQLKHTKSYASHEPVVIASNQDFEDQDWSGKGTEGDPYLIEGLSITSDDICIDIHDTTAHFEIKNCLLNSSSYQNSGIRFNNVENGLVANCDIGLKEYGINCENSHNMTFTSNTIYDCTSDGIHVSDGSGHLIKGNILTDTSDDGIEISYSSNCNVTDNELQGYHTAGIWQYFSSDCYIINNTVFGVSFPIYVQHSHDSFVIDNAVLESSNGIMLESSEKINVTRNSVTVCDRGISIGSSTECLFKNNTCDHAGFYFFGTSLEMFLHSISQNRVNEKPLAYFVNQSDTTIDVASYGQILLVNSDNVTLENGDVSNTDAAFEIAFSSNCSLRRSLITGCFYGVSLFYCEENVLSGLTIENCSFEGVRSDFSENCTVVDCSIRNSPHFGILMSRSQDFHFENCSFHNNGFGFWTDDLTHLSHSFKNVTINERPIGFFSNNASETIQASEYGQIILANCTDIRLENGSLDNSSNGLALFYCERIRVANVSTNHCTYGIHLLECNDCMIEDSLVLGCSERGISLWYSNETTIAGNVVTGAQSAQPFHRNVHVWYCTNCTILNNEISNGYFGIIPADSTQIDIINNTVSGCQRNGMNVVRVESCNIKENWMHNNENDGVWVAFSNNNNITANRFSENGQVGLGIDILSEKNRIHHNYFFENEINNAYDESGNNLWDDNSSQGNFWSNYVGSGTYQIPGSGESVDRFPSGYVLSIDHPEDITIEKGNTTASITWSPESSFPRSFAIDINETLDESGPWDGSSVSFSLSQLEPGQYTVSLTITDINRFSKSDSVNVTILPENGPLISVSHNPLEPTELGFVIVSASVSDFSGVADVILSYTDDGSEWHNVSMTYTSGDWEASIPAHPALSSVQYIVLAVDSLGHWSASDTVTYSVVGQTTTSSPTTTSTTPTDTTIWQAIPIELVYGILLVIVAIGGIILVKRRSV